MAINTSKILVGGIVGGIVANVIDFVSQTYILADMGKAAMAKLNLPTTPSGSSLVWLILLDFVWIIANVWIYAAIRPRFGPGPRTAAYAGLVSWVIGGTVAGFFGLSGLFGLNLFIASSIVALINSLVSTIVGARFYTEDATT